MNESLSSTLPRLEKPTRVRYGVLGFVCTLSMITYLDRVCFGSAAPHLVHDLGLSSVADLNLAFSLFAFSYAAFEIPSGWLGDMFGPRMLLIRIVLWWSLFTALTGLVGVPLTGGLMLGFWSLVAIRLLFGVGEAGAYPNITRALHNWLPSGDWAMGQGTVWMCGRLMGGLTPLIWLLLVDGATHTEVLEDGTSQTTVLTQPVISWNAAFWVFGGLGVCWCILFAVWFRNRPEEKASVNQAELDLIRRGRLEEVHTGTWALLRRLITSRNLWLLCLMYFCGAYGWYFNITYLPTFLEEQYGVPRGSLIGALYKGGPLWMGAITCLAGGWLSDRFIRRTGSRKWGRRLFGVIGHALCGVCWLCCLITPNLFTFFLAISFAAFFNDLTMGAAWATCQDIGRRYAAVVAGCMNTIGNLGGAAAGWITGLILKQSLAAHAASLALPVDKLSNAQKAAGLIPGYQINFVTFGAVYLIAVVFWLGIDSTRPVVPEKSGPAPA
jgi:MFS family permease